jgi:hypothetical protein
MGERRYVRVESFRNFEIERHFMANTAVKDLKKEVIELLDHADERMIKIIYAMLEVDLHEQPSDAHESDWLENMSPEERADVEEGIRQLENGEGVPHEEVKKMYSKWLSK